MHVVFFVLLTEHKYTYQEHPLFATFTCLHVIIHKYLSLFSFVVAIDENTS